MSKRTTSVVTAAATALMTGLLLAAAPALANKVAGIVVTGQVTAVRGDSLIIVQGVTYHIKPGSPAAAVLRTLAAGELVDMVLDGPPGSSASEVIGITKRSGN